MANQFDLLTLYSGDIWSFSLSFPDYPLVDYDVEIQLNKPGYNALQIKSEAEENASGEITFKKNSAVLNNNDGGNYSYRIIATSKEDQNVTTLETGTIEIKPNFLKGDARSYWQKTLENAKAAYKALTEKTVSHYSFEGRDFTYQDLSTLRKIINDAEQKIKKEKGEKTGVQFHEVRFI